MVSVVKREDWETQARNWLAWARAPEHDSYHDYGPIFFEQIVPPPGRRTLDLGCGEGRLTRELRARGHDVGVDASATLVTAARETEGGQFLVADAANLPIDDDSFDLVVAYNVLMDLDDLQRSLTEVARVLRPSGRLAICVLHPMAEAGSFASRAPDEPFVITSSYFEQRHYTATFEREGLTMTFSSSTYTLEAYARALESAGFLIESVREPHTS
jgi:ubiquinone/menaquinone biosynthesis C-methylase UbiE